VEDVSVHLMGKLYYVNVRLGSIGILSQIHVRLARLSVKSVIVMKFVRSALHGLVQILRSVSVMRVFGLITS
jgi:TRAP-type mannitol/chloroaromatic compound transport system permease small subunit